MERTKTFALLGNLEYTVRGGRVPKSRQVLADLLHITPVLRILPDGRLSTSGMLFGHRNLVGKFARYVGRRLKPDVSYRMSVGHAEAMERAKRLEAALIGVVPNIEASYFTEIGTALAVHGGPGTIVVAFQEYEAPASRGEGTTD